MPMSDCYNVTEVFASLQGEGVRAGTVNVFVRFQGCNLRCRFEADGKSPGGFDCDTEFASGRSMSAAELFEWIGEASGREQPIPPLPLIFTGGEPLLQLDGALIVEARRRGHFVAIETNGTRRVPLAVDDDVEQAAAAKFKNNPSPETFAIWRACFLADWITVSPKVAEHAVRQPIADEVKYVRHERQGIPRPSIVAMHYVLSPAFDGPTINTAAVRWCQSLCLENPRWRLSMQLHKVGNAIR